MIMIRKYLDSKGRSLFGKWFATITAPAAAKVATALVPIEQGNFLNSKGVRAGVYEYRIDFGPGSISGKMGKQS
jgi:putative component of toxin-antitoxin plasmid stabilization module